MMTDMEPDAMNPRVQLPWDDPSALSAAQNSNAICYRMVAWVADMPLKDEQREALLQAGHEAMALCGSCVAGFPAERPDSLLLLVCHTRFPASAHRATALWLCGHQLVETCAVSLEQEGTLLVGEEFDNPSAWRDHLPTTEAHDWWLSASPMDAATAHEHRIHLQTLVKRRQYAAIGGYVTRALRNDPNPGLTCFGLVPVMMEAVWSRHAEISLHQLTSGLELQAMARRPKEALLAWLGHLGQELRRLPDITGAAPIDRVVAAIRADCSLPYSQLNLSRSLGLTPAYFCRLFREKTGQHFSSFLTRTRMEQAQALLKKGGLSLQEVSERCGYPNKSYFCQVFKRYTGFTPGEFELHVEQEGQNTP